jgi:hypothetical protein
MRVRSVILRVMADQLVHHGLTEATLATLIIKPSIDELYNQYLDRGVLRRPLITGRGYLMLALHVGYLLCAVLFLFDVYGHVSLDVMMFALLSRLAMYGLIRNNSGSLRGVARKLESLKVEASLDNIAEEQALLRDMLLIDDTFRLECASTVSLFPFTLLFRIMNSDTVMAHVYEKLFISCFVVIVVGSAFQELPYFKGYLIYLYKYWCAKRKTE